MLKEFRDFAMRGNVIDLAFGVIIGVAFGAIVNSLVNDIIMPPIGYISGGLDFSNYFVTLKPGADGATSYASLKAAKDAGAVTINYGVFINAIINFLILTFIIFLLVRFVKKVTEEFEGKPEQAPQGPSEVDLLTEIRDELRKK